jgi:hypothetical protein
MKTWSTALLAAAACSAAVASPLRLEYAVVDLGGGMYDYTFELIVDNNDGTFVPGNGWCWIIFGDQMSADTNLTNFVGDLSDLPAGPYTQYQTSGGFHNGPTLGPIVIEDPPGSGNFVFVYWVPSGVGDSICWGGTSTANLADGSLLFSTLLVTGGAVGADFQVARRIEDAGCYADCNGDGSVNIFDFLCFQGLVTTGSPEADCNGDGSVNIFDFLCFQGAVTQGC